MDLQKKIEILLQLNLQEIKDNIEFFKKLDEEYKLNAKNIRGFNFKTNQLNCAMFSPKYIKNKKWRGLWLKATGIDLELYINWLSYGLASKEVNIIEAYKEAHPKEKYIPHSIYQVQKTLINLKQQYI